MIVNELTIAIFERDIPCGTEEVVQLQKKSADVNADTKTVYLAAAKKSSNLKHHYDDFRCLGKHFRVTKADDPNFSRHYTISNVMSPHIYKAYKDALVSGEPLASFATDD